MKQFDFAPNTLLFREGDPGDRFYIVLEGRLEIIKGLNTDEERLLFLRGPGDFIGEMGFLLPSGLRTASVRARTHVQLLEMTRETFDALLRRWPEVAIQMARTLSLRLRDSDNARIREMRKRMHEVSKVLSELQSTLSGVLSQAGEPKLKEGESLRLLNEFARFQAALVSGDESFDSHEKMLEAKRAIHRSRVPHLSIKTLGTFQVFRDEKPVEESEWEAVQPRLLLKAIIAHRSRGVPKDVLIEALWPEKSSVSGERNFKVILHRLRRTLEPQMDKGLGSSYIHLKGNLVHLDEGLCHVDLDAFLSCSRHGEKKDQEGDVNSAVTLYRQAIELYAGDFLPEDLYVPWVEAKREELRQHHLSLLFRTAELLEIRGNLKSAADCYRKTIQIDPTWEAAYQRLMLNYSTRGMRNAALKTYQDCLKALREELETEPDTLTVSLHRKLLES
jgi:DNA-binding SARP family transcriptional activator/CRP-like cAMP-binding protein